MQATEQSPVRIVYLFIYLFIHLALKPRFFFFGGWGGSSALCHYFVCFAERILRLSFGYITDFLLYINKLSSNFHTLQTAFDPPIYSGACGYHWSL